MYPSQDVKNEQELKEELSDLIRQHAKLEAYRQSLAEELHQVMQQRVRLKSLHGTAADSGSILNMES